MEEKVTQPQQYYTSPRSTFGRVINVLGNSALVAGSVLGIIGCALVYGSIIRMDSSILFIIAFSLWTVGSVGHLLYDIVTLPVRRNKRMIPVSLVCSISMVASMILMVVGAALTCGGIGEEYEYYDDMWTHAWVSSVLSKDLKQAGAILWIIGSGILVGSIVFKLFSTVLNNMANVKKTSGEFTRIRAFAGGFSVVLMLMASIPMCIGSGIFVTVRLYDSRVATSLWIIGFSLFGIGAIFNMFHLSPLHTSPLESRPQQEFVETKYVVTESEIVTVNIRSLIEKMEAESNNEQRLYQLLSFIGLGGQQYNYVEAMMLMNLFQWTSNKLEVLKALVHSRQLEMEPKHFAHLIASINPVHRSEVARLLFSKSMSINCNTALTILAQCENDESKFEMLTILAPHLHDEAHHWQIISSFNDQKCRQSVEDTLKKTAPSAPYV